MNQDLQNYIKQMREQGQSEARIRSELLKTGWTNEQIDAELSPAPQVSVSDKEGESNKTPTNDTAKASVMDKFKLSKPAIITVSVAAVIAVLVWVLAVTGIWNPFMPFNFGGETEIYQSAQNNNENPGSGNADSRVEPERNPTFPDSYALSADEIPSSFNSTPVNAGMAESSEISALGLEPSVVGGMYKVSYAASSSSNIMEVTVIRFNSQADLNYYKPLLRTNITTQQDKNGKFIMEKDSMLASITVNDIAQASEFLSYIDHYQLRLGFNPVEYAYIE